MHSKIKACVLLCSGENKRIKWLIKEEECTNRLKEQIPALFQSVQMLLEKLSRSPSPTAPHLQRRTSWGHKTDTWKSSHHPIHQPNKRTNCLKNSLPRVESEYEKRMKYFPLKVDSTQYLQWIQTQWFNYPLPLKRNMVLDLPH